MRRIILLTIGLSMLGALAAAHDFWLVPVGDEIHGVSGSNFPASENAVDPSRLVEATVVSSAGRRPLAVIGKRVVNGRDSVLVLKADPAIGGTFWATVTLRPRHIDLGAEDFNEYLRHDGLPQIYDLRRRRNELGRPAVERYQKFAKALIARPGAGSVAGEPVGHRIELVPLEDPATLRAGDTLHAEVRFESRPIAGLTVHAGYAGQAGGAHAQTHLSDAAGRIAIALTTSGTWYLRTIHMREISEPPLQWESFWASMTFGVR